MKNFYLFLISCFMYSTGFAQNLNDKFEYKVIYELTFQLDSTDASSEKSEYMILFLGDDLSKFSSRGITLSKQYEINGNSGQTSRQAVTKFHYQILKDYEANTLYYTLKIPKMDDRFYYTEKMDHFEWEILPETKTIKDFEVQKATTSFAGRDYIAWFTPEIPISDGPYKFNGLPGLILEIHDTEKEWVFDFFGLEKLSPRIGHRTKLGLYAKTEKDELLDLWHRYRRDPMGYANNPNVKMDAETHRALVEAFTKSLEKENNPLELE